MVHGCGNLKGGGSVGERAENGVRLALVGVIQELLDAVSVTGRNRPSSRPVTSVKRGETN
jgi:hypothetical protein